MGRRAQRDAAAKARWPHLRAASGPVCGCCRSIGKDLAQQSSFERVALGCAPAHLCNTYNVVSVPMKNAQPYGLPDGRELTQLPMSDCVELPMCGAGSRLCVSASRVLRRSAQGRVSFG